MTYSCRGLQALLLAAAVTNDAFMGRRRSRQRR